MPAAFAGLDVGAIGGWITDHVSGATPPYSFGLISGGHSNLTYTVTDAVGGRWILRRPPLGTLAPRAHDVAREWRIVAALRTSGIVVPRAAALCEDLSVTGAPFAVTAFVAGRVIGTVADARDALNTPWARRATGVALAETLGQVHMVDVDAVGLGDLAPRSDFVSRQVRTMREVWARTATRELPLMEDLATRLASRRPQQRYTGLVHCDYRLGNVMMSPAGAVVAVLDWELCTLGDALADVGFLVNNWDGPDDDGPQLWMQIPPTVAGGFCTRDELVECYSRATGFDVDDLEYYRAFAYWRMAVIAEGIKRRYESAAMGDATVASTVDFGLLESRVRHLAEAARALL